MKSITASILILFSLMTFAQNDTTIITSRDDTPLQAVLSIDAYKELYVGQEYTFSITSSGFHKLQVSAKNAHIELMERSKTTTGGLMYLVTPIITGKCSISVFNIDEEENVFSLGTYTYHVVEYPVPPLRIKGMGAGQIIDELSEITAIECSFSKELGVFDSYEIKSWTAVIGDITFSGNGHLLSREFINYVNKVENNFMLLTVQLNENKTGHFSAETVYLIRKSKKD